MRNLIMGSISICLSITMGSPGICDEQRQAPNIVVILADDMGYGDARALNAKSRIPTPNLDRLAAEGMTFTDGHTPSAVCTPTRYGLLTGRYCWRTRLKSGVLGGYSAPLIDAERTTIATMLGRQGYYTMGVGKWHLGMGMPIDKKSGGDPSRWDGDPGVDFTAPIADAPTTRGFDDFFAVSASLDMPPYVYIKNNRFTQVPAAQQQRVPFPAFVRSGPRAEDFEFAEVLDRLTQEATEAIRQRAGQEQPFFLYFPLTAPHKPTLPQERFRGKSGLGPYGDFILQVDDVVGRVMAALEETGQSDETLLLFTSDNGSYMYRYDDSDRRDHVDDPSIQGYRAEHHQPNGPLRGTKADVWEAGHRVPLFVRWPKQIAAGSKCTETVCLTDIFATCAEIAGGKLDNSMAEDSVSLLPLLREEKGASRGVPVIHHSIAGMFAIRQGKWKLVLGNGSGGRENPRGKPFAKPYHLFDLTEDIGETTNLADEHPSIVRQLSDAFHKIHDDGRSVTR